MSGEGIRRITISFNEIDDAEILAWLDGIGARKRSEAIREAIRERLEGDHGVDQVDQAERIAALVVDRLAGAGVLVSASGGKSRTPDVDPVVRDNLDAIGG